MPLRFWLGGAESDKSRQMYKYILDAADANPARQYLVIVPEQFGLSTQQELVFSSKNKGILNIDVLSFSRLAHRISDEVGSFASDVTLLDDTGKSVLIGMLAEKHKKDLSVFCDNLDKPGYIDKIKSIISEFMQYGITQEKAAELSKKAKDNGRGLLSQKLSDVAYIYKEFKDYTKERYTTVEETLDAVSSLVPGSDTIKNSVIVFDGFTGFTPVQNKLIGVLMEYALDIHVALLLEDCIQENGQKGPIQEHELFYLSKETIRQLERMADERRIIIADPYKADKNAIGNTCDLKEKIAYTDNTQKQKLNNTEKKIHIMAGQDPTDEIRMVFSHIKELIRNSGYRYKDIAILTGDLESYRHPIARHFKKHDIPFFIDKTEPIMLNPFIEYIRSFIDIVCDNYSPGSVFHFLKTGLSDISDDEINMLENYCIAAGIKGNRKWHEPFTAHTRACGPDELLLINATREKFINKCDIFIDALQRERSSIKVINAASQFTVRQFSKALYTLIESDGIEDKLRESAAQYGSIYVRIMDILDELCELIPDEKMDIRSFSNLLDAGFDNIRIGILPAGMDYVQVGDLQRSRFDNVKALFIVGANDGIIPKVESGCGIINENERDFLLECDDELKLAPSAREAIYNQQLYIYMAERIPSEHLFVSYAKTSSDGKSLLPSYIVSRLSDEHQNVITERNDDICRYYNDEREAFDALGDMIYPAIRSLLPKAQQIRVMELVRCFAASEKYKDRLKSMIEKGILKSGSDQTDSIGAALAHAIYGKRIIASITRLEAYANCAYRYFLEYGLSLQDREVFAFEASDIGTIFHESMKEYSLLLKESGADWAKIAESDREKLMDEAVSKVIKSKAAERLSSTARNAYMENRIRRIMQKSAKIVTSQIKQGEFRPRYFEIDFDHLKSGDAISVKLGDDEMMRLQGRIDRIDTCETDDGIYVRVIDYKSSDHDMDLAAVYEGRQLQLLVYLNAAVSSEKERIEGSDGRSEENIKKVVPAGILYYRLDDPLIDAKESLTEDDLQKLVMKKMRFSGLVNSDIDILKLQDKDIAGDSNVIPAGIGAKGTVKATSSAVSTDDFAVISQYVSDIMEKQGQKILAGDIAIPKPDGEERFTGPDCRFCGFSSVCMEKKRSGSRIESDTKMKNEEWIALMRKKNQKTDDNG